VGLNSFSTPPRRRAVGPIQSAHFRDPDANLIEVAVYE